VSEQRIIFELSHPMIITSRLLPGVRVGDATVSVTPERDMTDDYDRRRYWRYHIDVPANENGDAIHYESADLSEPWRPKMPDGADACRMVSTVLSFLLNEVDRYRAAMNAHVDEPRDGDPWAFNREIAEWAYIHSTDIEGLMIDIGEY
jgi:hypothetical protein